MKIIAQRRKIFQFLSIIPPKSRFLNRERYKLPLPLIHWAKRLLFILRLARDFFLLVKNIFFYKLQSKSARILFCLANPGSIGGTELQVQILAEYFKEKRGGCLVLLIGRIEGGRANDFIGNLRSRSIPFLSLGRVYQICRLKWISWFFRFAAPEAEICHFFNPAATFLASCAKEAGLRIFYTETGMPDEKGEWRVLKDTIRYFDCVASVSQAGLDGLKKFYGYRGLTLLTPSMIAPFPVSPRLNKNKGEDFHLIYFGRLTPIKGVDRLIRSFARLVEQVPRARLSVIGFGESFCDLRQLALDLAVSGRIHFTGWIDRPLLLGYLQDADLFCLPSETEGLPSSILEAMSLGLPILATDVGGVSEIVENGVSAILIPPCNEELLTEALLQLALDPALRDRLASRAFLNWRKREDKNHTIEVLERLYESC